MFLRTYSVIEEMMNSIIDIFFDEGMSVGINSVSVSRSTRDLTSP